MLLKDRECVRPHAESDQFLPALRVVMVFLIVIKS